MILSNFRQKSVSEKIKIRKTEKSKKLCKPVRVYGIYGTISDIFNERE